MTPEWAMVVVTGIYVLLTGIYVCFSIKALCILKKQSRTAEIAAKAAKRSADALINSERAWVLVMDAEELPFSHDLKTRAPSIKNFGRSTARVRKASIGCQILRSTEKLPQDPVYTNKEDFDYMLPPEGSFRPVEMLIPEESIQRVKNGELSLWVYGFVGYDTLELEGRVTRYCLIYCLQRGDITAGFYPAVKAPLAYTRCT